MANLNIAINIATKDQSSGPIGRIKQTLGGLGKIAGNIAMGGLALVGTALTGIGLAAVAAGKASLRFGDDVNSGMRLLQARTGAADESMAGLKSTALGLFSSGLGDDINDVSVSMATVEQVTGATGEALQATTEDALIMKRVFEKDVQESVRAVDTAVETFGGNSGRIFDMLTTTIQRTGDPADDLLDTVNEYSTVFAQTGFSADQMFGMLTRGIDQGARDFDVIADAAKEFLIRIVDGSDTTSDALNDLFYAVDGVGGEFVEINREIDETSAALDKNAEALENAEGAFAASKMVVSQLKTALSDARRELNDLARPNLAGMQEFDDTLFDLDQQADRVRLSMLDMMPDSDTYAAAQAKLDSINKEMDRVSLQRDIQFEPQLRAIEQAAQAGTEPLQTYDQVMTAIGQKKGEIAGLEQAWAAANAEMGANASQVDLLKSAQVELVANLATLESSLETANTPAKEFLGGFTDGSLTGADAMSQVIQKLAEVEDPLQRNAIGVALFGTKWEDLGQNIILALDPAKASLGEVESATDRAFEASQTLGDQWYILGRDFLVAMEPAAQEVLPLFASGLEMAGQFMTEAAPVFSQFGVDLRDNLGPAMLIINDSAVRIAQALGLAGEEATGMDVAMMLLKGTLDLVVTAIQAVALVSNKLADAIELAAGLIDQLNTISQFDIGSIYNATSVALTGGTFSENVTSLVPGFAGGVSNFSGGLAVVGERGPELVDLPRGSSVIPNNQMSSQQPLIGTLVVYANDEAGGGRAANTFLDTLRSKGLR